MIYERNRVCRCFYQTPQLSIARPDLRSPQTRVMVMNPDVNTPEAQRVFVKTVKQQEAKGGPA